jgi:hypothetical protein
MNDLSGLSRTRAALAAAVCAVLLAPAAAAAQAPAGAEYVEQVPGFAGEEQTTVEADQQPANPRQSEPQQRSAPAQAPTSQPEPIVTSEPVTSDGPAPVKKRRKPRQAPLGAHDTPPVSTPSTTSSGELAPAGGGGDSLMWLALLLGAMAVAIPATAVYARRYGSA